MKARLMKVRDKQHSTFEPNENDQKGGGKPHTS